MPNDTSSALSLLNTRRSGRPRDLTEPGPSDADLIGMIRIASRVPDHGKLAPWRFVHVRKADRPAFAALLHRAYRVANPDPTRPELEAVDRLANQAPTLIVALSRPVRDHKIPVWEQELSCGAACMNLLLAAHALGFAAGWVTGWAAYSETVRQAFAGEGERIAGLIFIGTPAAPLEDRPRPPIDQIYENWDAPSQFG